MTDPHRGRAAAFLRRMGLLAALVSIVAGILGMHVMGSGHSTHSIGAGHGSHYATPSSNAVLQETHEPETHEQTVQLMPQSCGGAGSCTSVSATGAVCVPAPSHNTLAAPLPGTLNFANGPAAGPATRLSAYSHRPESPSPGDLCISRT